MKQNAAVPAPASLSDRHCLLYTAPGSLLLVCCQYDVPAEQANALSKALMAEVCPDKVRPECHAIHP